MAVVCLSVCLCLTLSRERKGVLKGQAKIDRKKAHDTGDAT